MRYHNITTDDMLNGDGLRTVLWLSGCEHHCKGCHNPITWNPDDGLEFDNAAKEELFSYLAKDYISGITFSGGDPLFPANSSDVGFLIDEIKEKFPNKTIWLYTGYLWEDISNFPFISKLDVVVDGKFVSDLYNPKLHWCGSSNQRIIDVKRTLEYKKIILHEGE